MGQVVIAGEAHIVIYQFVKKLIISCMDTYRNNVLEICANRRLSSSSLRPLFYPPDVLFYTKCSVVEESVLFKKGSRNKPENYKQVSLTSVACKLLETLIRDHMVEFLVKHKLINTSQHGFLKAKSYLTNILCFFEEITKWVDDG